MGLNGLSGIPRADRPRYCAVSVCVYYSLVPNAKPEQCRRTVLDDWGSARGDAPTLLQKPFMDFIFDFASVWCDSVDPDEYVQFMNSVIVGAILEALADGLQAEGDVASLTFGPPDSWIRSTGPMRSEPKAMPAPAPPKGQGFLGVLASALRPMAPPPASIRVVAPTPVPATPPSKHTPTPPSRISSCSS